MNEHFGITWDSTRSIVADDMSDIQTKQMRGVSDGVREFWFRVKSILRSVATGNELINIKNNPEIIRVLSKQEK